MADDDWCIPDESKIHSLLIHFSDLFFLYNCLFLFGNTEILPNLYFVDFYRRNGSSSKYTEAISGQVAWSRRTLEVVTSNSVIQQFLKSQQRTQVATRSDSKPNKSSCDRRKFSETK